MNFYEVILYHKIEVRNTAIWWELYTNAGIGMIEGSNNEGSNEFLSRSILMDYIKEGETIGTAAAVIQV